MREPAYTPEQKHIRSIGRIGSAAVSSTNSFRRLIYVAIAILRELKRSDSDNHRQKTLKFRELQRQDNITVINTMYPLRNAERIELLDWIQEKNTSDVMIRIYGKTKSERKAA